MKRGNKILIILLFFPLISNAQFISEIMYDLEGSDSGREWVEVYNNGSSINLSTWRLFENSTNHSINLIEGSENIGNGEIAIIADNTDKFLEDNPSFSGNLFDSSFSLSNTGETLILKDADLNEIFSVSYLSEWGAGGDGNSLNLNNGSWEPGEPSPSTYSFSGEEITTTENEEETEETSSGGTSSSSFPVIPQIEIIGSAPETAIVGAHALFEAKVFGLEGEAILNARVFWNFGDGTTKEGSNILYNFKYPGDYVVFANAASGEFSATEKFVVKVIPSEVLIYGLDNTGEFIRIINSSNEEINLSWWILKGRHKSFVIPKNTFILPNTEIILSQSTTGIDSRERPLNLLYPNGEVAFSYQDFDNPGVSLNTVPDSPTIGSNNIEEEILLLEEEIVNLQTASAGSIEPDTGNQTIWYILFILLVLISTSVIIFARKRIGEPKFEEEDIVEDIEIIE